MITDLWIENFKGIGKRQHIPLRPITLLFGANSAGKSTVLHAIHYLREILCNNNTDPRRALAGSTTVNLGGFKNLLHNREPKRITLAAAVEWTGVEFEGLRYLSENSHQRPDGQIDWHYHRTGSFVGLESHGWEPPAVTIQLTIDNAILTSIQFAMNGEPCAQIWAPLDLEADRPLSLKDWKRRELFRPLIPRKVGWINPWSAAFLPERASWYEGCESSEAAHKALNDSAAEKRRRFVESLSEKLSPVFDGVSESVVSFPEGASRVCYRCTNLLDLPSEPVPLSIPANESLAVFPIADVLRRLDVESALVSRSEPPDLSGIYVSLHRHEFGPSAGCLIPDALLATQEGKLSLVDAVELLRLVCTNDPLAAALQFDAGRQLVPSIERPLQLSVYLVIDSSEAALCHLSERQGLVDEMVRGSLASLQHSLETFTYVGPKRATVPRTLNSDVIDDHSTWGDGLGAWRWMLGCDGPSLESCSDWLSNPNQGLGTGFKLERKTERLTDSSIFEAELHGAGLVDIGEAPENEYLLDDYYESPEVTRITLRESATGKRRHPQDVGEGITQVIPVVAALVYASNPRNGTVLCAIEQPELHLHPSLAAKIGDLVVATMLPKRYSCALIETHSEHLILRILRRIRQTTNNELPEHIPAIKPDDVCVLWVDNLGDGTTITRLRIDGNGEFIDRWPKGFFREREEDLFG